MNKKLRKLQLQMIDQHLAKVRVCDRPSSGWIAAIRKSLGMSVRQMAKRIGITQQSASRLEANEVDDVITLKSLRKVASALDCRLVYALVPNKKNLQKILEKQAIEKAKNIVSAVDHTMQLESQAVGNLEQKVEVLAKELAETPNSKLWD